MSVYVNAIRPRTMCIYPCVKVLGYAPRLWQIQRNVQNASVLRYINPRPAEIKRGTALIVEYQRRRMETTVALASSNGRSLILQFEGILGGYVGMMPIVWEDEFMGYMDLINNVRVRFIQREG